MTQPAANLDRYLRPEHGIDAEVFVEPSAEARFLLRHAAWLVSPPDRAGSAGSRFVRMAMVAPFTQMTFVSFDLQAFLFGVFHQSKVAQIGHLVFMVAVNFFLMVGLSQLELGGLNAAHIYTCLLLFWYTAVAATQRLPLWAGVSALLTLGLFAASQALVHALSPQGLLAAALVAEPTTWAATSLQLLRNPWLCAALSAFMIAVSHAPEPRLPPRAAEKLVWKSVPAFILGPPARRHSVARRVVNGLRTAMFMVWGTLDEGWAAPRLMPYNFLMVMFKLGYAPERYRQLTERVDRAVASGNPALDYVGIGGGTFLQLPDEPISATASRD